MHDSALAHERLHRSQATAKTRTKSTLYLVLITGRDPTVGGCPNYWARLGYVGRFP